MQRTAALRLFCGKTTCCERRNSVLNEGASAFLIRLFAFAAVRALQTEYERLKKIVADLQLDKLILKESLDHLKPRA